jgi:hypothetical protein
MGSVKVRCGEAKPVINLVQDMKGCGGMEVRLHAFASSSLYWGCKETPISFCDWWHSGFLPFMNTVVQHTNSLCSIKAQNTCICRRLASSHHRHHQRSYEQTGSTLEGGIRVTVTERRQGGWYTDLLSVATVVELSISCPGHFTPRKGPPLPYIRSCCCFQPRSVTLCYVDMDFG